MKVRESNEYKYSKAVYNENQDRVKYLNKKN